MDPDEVAPFFFTTLAATWFIGIGSIMFEYSGWWLILPVGSVLTGSVLYGFIMLLNILRLRAKRARTERTLRMQRAVEEAVETRRAIERRAETQNTYLWEGMLNNDHKKINHALYGDYKPAELAWPERLKELA